MAVWTCEDCGRSFGAAGQGHMCSPGRTIAEFLADVAEFVAPVLHRVHDHLVSVDDDEPDGGLIVDPLMKPKVLFKNGPTFCVVDVKKKWVAVGFSVRRKIDSGRMSRKTVEHGGKFFHVVNVTDPETIDDEFCEWLTEAYYHGTSSKPSSFDPMVPDDVDIW